MFYNRRTTGFNEDIQKYFGAYLNALGYSQTTRSDIGIDVWKDSHPLVAYTDGYRVCLFTIDHLEREFCLIMYKVDFDSALKVPSVSGQDYLTNGFESFGVYSKYTEVVSTSYSERNLYQEHSWADIYNNNLLFLKETKFLE